MNIAHLRLNNQRIIGSSFSHPSDVVAHMGAMQAQDCVMTKWALGVRIPQMTERVVEDAINAGSIVRTHILRPTWHLVAAKDIRWMLALTAPHVSRLVTYTYRQLELTESILNQAISVMAKLLEGHNYLTRAELMAELGKEGIPTNDLRSAHLMFHAELNGIVCNGPMKGKQITYALMDERVPLSPALARDEALGQLAKRFFVSHGPATLADFAWWSGLKITDARAGLEMVKSHFVTEKFNEEVYWMPNALPTTTQDTIHLLPAFDEFMVSYKDRTASLSAAHQANAISSNGIFKPIVVVNGQVKGVWKRTLKKETVEVETTLFEPFPLDNALLSTAIEGYARFLGKKP
jgi:Winged helix DNA-binding domain